MIPEPSSEALIAYLKQVAERSPTDAVDEALRLKIWTPGSPWHREEVLVFCAQLAAKVNEYRLAGLAAYLAQRLHLSAMGAGDSWGLPDLPGLEVAARQFNLVRYTPVHSRNIRLRRPRVSDRDFLMQMFLDAEFSRQYSRPAIGREEARVHELIRGDQRCPTSGDPWAWVIADAEDHPLGLLELSKPDFKQRSVDLSMGFHVPQFATIAIEAFCLGMSMAFHHLGMERVTGQVYADNRRSHQLHAHMGSVREYTLDGLVYLPGAGSTIPMTLYSMTRDEARASPWLVRVRHFFPESFPDLLLDEMDSIAASIIERGPRWAIFPPTVLPRVPAPPPEQAASEAAMSMPPACIEGKRVNLRPITFEDRDTLLGWINTAGFIKVYSGGFDADMDIDAMSERLGNEPGQSLIWLVEDSLHQTRIGFIGFEFRNGLPVLFGLSGFSGEASRRHIVESWQLLRKVLFTCYPNARLYLKLPEQSSWLAFLQASHDFQHRGVERNQHCMGYDGPVNLVILDYTNRAE